MISYGQALDTLERELQGVSDTFASLSDEEWRSETLLEPYEAERPRWTVFELAGHMDISIGLTRMLIASQQDGQPGRDQISDDLTWIRAASGRAAHSDPRLPLLG